MCPTCRDMAEKASPPTNAVSTSGFYPIDDNRLVEKRLTWILPPNPLCAYDQNEPIARTTTTRPTACKEYSFLRKHSLGARPTQFSRSAIQLQFRRKTRTSVVTPQSPPQCHDLSPSASPAANTVPRSTHTGHTFLSVHSRDLRHLKILDGSARNLPTQVASINHADVPSQRSPVDVS